MDIQIIEISPRQARTDIMLINWHLDNRINSDELGAGS